MSSWPETSLITEKIGTVSAKTLVADTVPEAAQENGTVDPKKKMEGEEDESQYLTVEIVAVVMAALYLSMFLVTLVSWTRMTTMIAY